MADLNIMYQPIGGGWVKLGTQTGGGRGVLPGSIRLEGDRGEGGCLSASFKLKQDPRWIAFELDKATPIAVWDGSEPIWSGRVAESPTTFGEDDIEVTVNCQGWWQHLKDDCTDREWVINDLSKFTPNASMIGAAYNAHQPTVPSVDGRAIMLPAPQGSSAVGSRLCAVTLDAGPNNLIKKAVATFRQQAAPASPAWFLYARISNTIDALTAGLADATQANPAANTQYFLTPSHGTGGRYLHLFWYWNGATIAALPSDLGCVVEAASIFTDSADESGNASILKASTVISETLDAIAPLISSRRDRITTTTLSLPQFPGGAKWRYADELIKQANAYHGYIARLTPEPTPVFEYFPVPTDYRFVVNEGQYTFLEPAAQALQGVASRVITEFEDAAGVKNYSQASAAASTNARATPQTDVTITNPSFDTNTTGWTASGSSSISRSTATFDTTPASGQWTLNNQGDTLTGAMTGTARFGKSYIIAVAIRSNAVTVTETRIKIGTTTDYVEATIPVTTAWVTHVFNWTPRANAATPSIILTNTLLSVAAQDIFVDSITMGQNSYSAPLARGFTRTFLRPMTQRSTAATAQAIAQLELDNAQFPPFKGTIGVTGRIPLKGGGTMDVSHVPALVGENILIANLHDPNTQGFGRVGNIQSAVYDHDKRQVTIGIDRDLSFITELRNRLELFSR